MFISHDIRYLLTMFGFYQKVNLEIEYITVDEPSTVRVSYFTRVLITTLPISVNVEDFFRGTRLIIFSIGPVVFNLPQIYRLVSKFTVSSTSHQHVRIANATLDLPTEGLEGVQIRPSLTKRRVVVSLTESIHFLFLTTLSDCDARTTCQLPLCP